MIRQKRSITNSLVSIPIGGRCGSQWVGSRKSCGENCRLLFYALESGKDGSLYHSMRTEPGINRAWEDSGSQWQSLQK